MKTEPIGSLAGLEALRPEWSELHSRCPRATPFQSPEWLIPWTRHLFGGGDIWALAMRDAGELVGLAPLFCWGIERRFVSFLGAGISDYGDVLFAPGLERACVAEMWLFLDRMRGQWDALDLQEVRCGSALLHGRLAEQCSVCPVLDLGTYPESMDRKHRTDLRRAQNKLRDKIRFATAGFEEFLPLYQARWGPMADPLQRFHREAGGEFHLLHIDAEPAAAIHTLNSSQTLYCYLSGYDPSLAKLSPGAVLLGWVLDQATARGVREADFLRKTESYKYLWGARDRINYKIVS